MRHIGKYGAWSKMGLMYLDRFFLASREDEVNYILSYDKKMMMTCYDANNVYPFKIFPQKEFSEISFSPITIFYGGNGSGKTTLLNVIAEKLGVMRSAPFNNTPFFEEYLKFCSYKLIYGEKVPKESRIITSDDVFDFLLDVRKLNEEIDTRRETLFSDYDDGKYNSLGYRLSSIDDLDELKRRNDARRKTKSAFVNARIGRNVCGHSNGESAYEYFTDKIKDGALYLLDEPENSLSAEFQQRIAEFIEQSARFYNCQFVISTHSPFLLAIKGARIFDLDALPVREARFSELENIKLYFELFEKHKREFL